MMDEWIASRLGLPFPLNRKELVEAQLSRLNRILSYAGSHSRFYKERFEKGSVASFEEFAALPFTTPDDLRFHGSEMLCVPADDVDRIVTLLETSGSEGKPKRVYFTAADQERTIDFFHHGMLEFAVPGDRILILFPGNSPGSLNVLLSEALLRMNCQSKIFGFPAESDYDAVLSLILDESYNRLVGPAPTIAALASHSVQTGLNAKIAAVIDSVLLAGSFVSEENCQIIRNYWNCRIDEEYGMTETGYGGGVGCKVCGGYHLWESDLYYEVIDPKTLMPVPDGVAGELVVTTLNREAMPFIRYRTGDISRILPGLCPCGSILKHLERVQSRPSVKKYLRNRFQ